MYQIKQYLSIEGLRGVLALTVCLGHFGFGTLFESVGLQFNFHYAVDLFFVISGFVLASANYYNNQPVTAYEFTLKRLARLYPLHLLTLMLMVGLNFLKDKPSPILPFIENLFLIHNIGILPADNSFNFPSWSISVELWCTLLLFFITQYLRNTKILITLFVTYIVLQSLFLPTLLIDGDYEGSMLGIFNTGLLRAIAGICLGVLTYLILQSARGKKLFQNPLLGYISILGLSIYIFLNPGLNSSIAFYLFAFFLIGHCAYHPNFLKLLRTRLLVWLGSISYSIYLLHIPLYYILQTFWGDLAVKGWQGKFILLSTLLIASSFSFLFFERPLQKMAAAKVLRSQHPAFANNEQMQGAKNTTVMVLNQ